MHTVLFFKKENILKLYLSWLHKVYSHADRCDPQLHDMTAFSVDPPVPRYIDICSVIWAIEHADK